MPTYPMSNSLEGTWQMIRAELDGEAAPEMVVDRTDISFEGNAWIMRFAGKISARGTFVEAVEHGTRTLLLSSVEGLHVGSTIPCIYQLAGDRLRICFGLNNQFPSSFFTQGTTSRYLAVYKRIQPSYSPP